MCGKDRAHRTSLGLKRDEKHLMSKSARVRGRVQRYQRGSPQSSRKASLSLQEGKEIGEEKNEEEMLDHSTEMVR